LLLFWSIAIEAHSGASFKIMIFNYPGKIEEEWLSMLLEVSTISIHSLHQFCIEISKGTKIFILNLQTSLNLLLDESFRVKVADFGWTRTMAATMTGKIGKIF